MTADYEHPRPRNPRLARQSHTRSGSHVGRRLLRPRRGAERRIDRFARSRRTARRRQVALSRQGRQERRRQRQRRHRESAERFQRRRPGRPRQETDRSRRLPEQRPPRRERAARRFDGERARGRRIEETAAVEISRRFASGVAAGADDEHRQRRRACRQQRRHAGIHGAAGRPAEFFRSAARRCGNFPFAEKCTEGERLEHRGRRRRRLRAGSEIERAGRRDDSRSDRQDRLSRGQGCLSRPRRRQFRILQRRRVSSRRRGQETFARTN